MSLVTTLRSVRLTAPAPWLASLLALGALTACSSPSKSAVSSSSSSMPSKTHAEISDEVTESAKVVAVDQSTRMVTLMAETGEGVTVHCGDEVRNFAQISVGDTLKVHYKRMLGATLLPAGSDPAVATGCVVAARAPAGGMPGAGVGAGISIRVKIVSVDTSHDVVLFSLPTGQLVARTLMTAEGRDFAKGLKVGDLVQLDFAEAMAISVEKS